MMAEQPKTVLFVEDDAVDRMAITRAAGRGDFPYGYKMAGTRQQAEEMLAAETFAALVLDYRLADGTAFDLFERAGGAPIIVVTGAGDVEIAIRAMKMGAFDFLEKDPQGNYLKVLPMTIASAVRRQAEELELAAYRQRLEELVAERTAALEETAGKLDRAARAQGIINQLLQVSLAPLPLEEQLSQALAVILSLPGLGLRQQGAIFLPDEDGASALVMKAEIGLDPRQKEVCRRVPFGTCVCGKAAVSGRTEMLSCHDARHEIRLMDAAPHAHWCAPIRSGDRLLGVLSLYLDPAGTTSPDELQTLDTVASTLAGIIERARAEEDKQRLLSQLHESQKLESVGRLAGGVAHDFNNILCAINGYAELGLMKLGREDPVHEFFEVILSSGKRAADLVSQLLAFSRKQLVSRTVLNLNDVIATNQKMLGRLIGEDIVMRLVLADPLWEVKADFTQMNQILLNLAVNARDAMPEGGTLAISTANVRLDEQLARRYHGVQAGDYVTLTMTDTGCGMSPQILDRIFEPFFTTKETGKGTGLGLSTVYGIVRQHDGAVTVESAVGKGSTFVILLPRCREVAAEARETGGEMPRGNETILVAEDEKTLRSLTQMVLTRLGYTVLEADDGEQALRLAREHQGTIHLLLTDVVMPRMGGAQLAQQMLAQFPGVKLLFMSGYAEETPALHALVDKDTFILNKPFTPATLSQAVRNTLDSR
ncbi:MAG: response regulator [Thermodesulfobacteriota bacterium]